MLFKLMPRTLYGHVNCMNYLGQSPGAHASGITNSSSSGRPNKSQTFCVRDTDFGVLSRSCASKEHSHACTKMLVEVGYCIRKQCEQ